MTTGQKHALIAAACASPLVAYQAREVAQRDEGWPLSRFFGLLPLWAFLGGLALFNGWFTPHIVRKILRRVAAHVVTALEDFDESRNTFDPEEIQ